MEKLIYMNNLFCFDTKRHTLKEEGKKVPLTEKGAQVLLELVEHEGEVVAKVDLIEKIWGESRYKGNYVEQKIHELRKVFRDDPKDPKYIMTLSGVGYKSVAHLRIVNPALEARSAVLPDLKDLHGLFIENLETNQVSEVLGYPVDPLATLDPSVLQGAHSLADIICSPSFRWPVDPETYQILTANFFCRAHRS